MHPMAAYCALRGLVAARLQNEPKECIRIVSPGPNPQLVIGLHAGLGGWAVYNAMYSSYPQIPWSEIPDSALDRLPQKLVDSICS